MRSLTIVWQRLVSASGATCERCGLTFESLQRALDKLKDGLAALDIDLKLETVEISEAAFKASPSESNRIWIADRPLEEWLGAWSGKSRCCSACGDSDCRTLEIGGEVFEAVPADVIIRAVFRAVTELFAPKSATVLVAGESCVCAPACSVDARST